MHHLVCFCKYFGNVFSNSFANSQWYKNMIWKAFFKILKVLPLFQMLFLWLNKSSPWRSSPLSCQGGFCNWNNFSPLEIVFENRVVVRSFCFGAINSPPLALIAKNKETWEAFEFSPFGKKIWVKVYTNWKFMSKAKDKWYRQSWSGSLTFAEYTISLSICD